MRTVESVNVPSQTRSQFVLELVLHFVAGAHIPLLGEEVRDVVRAAELERDDMVDLKRLPYLRSGIPYSVSTASSYALS